MAEFGTQTDPDMGSGASRDGEELVDDQYVTRSQTGSASGPHSPRPRSDRGQISGSRSGLKQGSKSSMSRNVESMERVAMVSNTDCYVCEPSQGMEEPIVGITNNGFNVADVIIMEGQSVIFVWQPQTDAVDIVQVIHDGEKLRPVIGGFSGSFAKTSGQYEQQFNLEGEYKFAL
ncbi:hypothetical protein DPMN_113233, partial [Dreissena polymorpha]